MRALLRRPCPLEWAKQEIGRSRNDAARKQTAEDHMKTELSTFAHTLFRVRGVRRTAAWLATVALGAWSALVSHATVIDNFENGVKFSGGGGGMDYFTWEVTGGQLVVSRPSPVPSPPNNALLTYDSVYWPVPGLSASTLDKGHTLELRMDCVHASADDLFLVLGCGGPTGGADSTYAALVDRNEVALTKYREGGNLTVFYWDTVETPFPTNVTIRLIFRKTDDGLEITVRVVDKGNAGATLYERSFTDGPGQDAPVPLPDPHGMGIWTADEGAPYADFTYAAAGVWQIIPTEPPPLEMRLDNLEYDVYALEIANSVLLSWSPNMPGEQIVVGADAIEGPYAPVPEPMFERFGSLCVSVPTTAQHQFFTLVPGTQFSDGFSDPVQPYANRLPWELLWEETNDEITVANGVMRIRRLGSTWAGVLIRPPEELVVRDFYSSVDIRGFTSSGGNWCSVFIMVNGVFRDNQGSAEGNGAGLTFNSGALGRVMPSVYNGPQESRGQQFDIAELPPPYRLEFSGVGSDFRFRVVHLATKTTISEQQVPRTVYFDGWVGLYVSSPDQNPTTHDLSLDNFFVTGTKP